MESEASAYSFISGIVMTDVKHNNDILTELQGEDSEELKALWFVNKAMRKLRKSSVRQLTFKDKKCPELIVREYRHRARVRVTDFSFKVAPVTLECQVQSWAKSNCSAKFS